VIVSLHVATGAVAGAATRSRLLALALGPPLHLAGDRVPHRDMRSQTLDTACGIACLAVLAACRGLDDPATVGAVAAAAPDLEHVFRLPRPGGSKLFHGRRGWHRRGRFPVAAQLALAALLVVGVVRRAPAEQRRGTDS